MSADVGGEDGEKEDNEEESEREYKLEREFIEHDKLESESESWTNANEGA